MAGFFDFMQRMVDGRPVFDAEPSGGEKPAQPTASPEPASKATIRKNDQYSFPVARVKRMKTHLNGPKMQVYAWIVNSWPEEVELDKVRLLGVSRELDTVLRGGEEREFLLYDGPRPTHPESEMWLDYKTQREGDYFQTVHEVKFDYHQDDQTYTVSDIQLHEPVRDIYG